METELTLLLVLAAVAFVAGFVDSIAGGGGLLALPALLLAGLDPVAALATTKLQGAFGTASATYTFWKKGNLQPRQHIPEIIFVFIGAALGVFAVAYVPTRFLYQVMPPLLIVIAIYFAMSPLPADVHAKSKWPMACFTFGLAPIIGFYDGLFGPGTGSFFMLALVAVFGINIVDATGRTKLLNFTSNVAALIMFATGGKIVWTFGLAMGLAQFAGARIGASLAIRNGASMIRPLMVIVSLTMAIRLLWQFNA